jgi:hypothetical protein
MADSFLSQHMIAVKMATIKQNRYRRGTTLLENPVSARSNINDLQPNSRRNCRRWVRLKWTHNFEIWNLVGLSVIQYLNTLLSG